MSDITTAIEIKSYLKKYLVKVYGPEPICFPKNHDYNRLFVRLLQKPPSDYKPEPPSDKCIAQIMLPFNNLKNIRVYNYLSRESQIIIRKEIDADFMLDYKKYIEKTMIEQKVTRKEATLLCMKMYEISETEITFDAFYKNFYRKMLIRTACFSFSIF
jgi:hypothetical protein